MFQVKVMSETDKQQDKKSRLNPLQVVGSVLAAAFGVQSRSNRERDFQEGKFFAFIVTGILFTLILIGTVYLVVSTVLEHAR
jgi:hypothetical protein